VLETARTETNRCHGLTVVSLYRTSRIRLHASGHAIRPARSNPRVTRATALEGQAPRRASWKQGAWSTGQGVDATTATLHARCSPPPAQQEQRNATNLLDICVDGLRHAGPNGDGRRTVQRNRPPTSRTALDWSVCIARLWPVGDRLQLRPMPGDACVFASAGLLRAAAALLRQRLGRLLPRASSARRFLEQAGHGRLVPLHALCDTRWPRRGPGSSLAARGGGLRLPVALRSCALGAFPIFVLAKMGMCPTTSEDFLALRPISSLSTYREGGTFRCPISG
jgi:hypothetical protein